MKKNTVTITVKGSKPMTAEEKEEAALDEQAKFWKGENRPSDKPHKLIEFLKQTLGL